MKNLGFHNYLNYSVGLEEIDSSLVEPGKILRVSISKVSRQSVNGNCLLKGEYPIVEGLRNKDLQNSLNRSIRKRTIEITTQRFQSLLEEEYCRTEPASEWKWQINLNNCLTKFARKSLISIACRESDGGMGAYPNDWARAVTFDLKSGEMYDLPDLFKPGSDYSVPLNQFLFEDLINLWGNPEGPLSKGILEGVRDTSSFYLASNCEHRGAVSIGGKLIYKPEESCMIFPDLFTSGPTRNITLKVSLENLEDALTNEGSLRILLD